MSKIKPGKPIKSAKPKPKLPAAKPVPPAEAKKSRRGRPELPPELRAQTINTTVPPILFKMLRKIGGGFPAKGLRKLVTYHAVSTGVIPDPAKEASK